MRNGDETGVPTMRTRDEAEVSTMRTRDDSPPDFHIRELELPQHHRADG